MNERETAQAIADRAAEWVARVDRAAGDAVVQAKLEAWLGDDVRRRGAYFRAQAAWAMLDRASVLRAGQGYEPEEAPERSARLTRRRMLWGGGAMVAGVAISITGFDLLSSSDQRIETALGEIRRVPLHDGSFAAVNTETTLDVTLKPKVRRVALARGEAWFQVAKDRARPFIVESGDVRVRAVGTAFAVRRTENGVDVQVTEGVVEVWRTGDEANARRVAAGARTFVGNAAAPVLAPAVVSASAEIDRALSWRSGQLVFDGDTVAEAAAEFNRYNQIKIEIADPTLGQEKMIGRFRTNEPDAFVRAAATLLDAHAEARADRIILSRH